MAEYRGKVENCVKKKETLLDNCIILINFVACYYPNKYRI